MEHINDSRCTESDLNNVRESQQVSEPLIASRSENAILRDMAGEPREKLKSQHLRELLGDVLNSIEEINPMLRAFIRYEAKWDLDRLEERLKEGLGDSEE